MRFNIACVSAALFAAVVAAVPVEACPAPVPQPAPAPAPQPVPVPAPAPEPAQPEKEEIHSQQCGANTSLHCCETVSDTSNAHITQLLNAAGIDHQEATSKGQVGLTCTPITTSALDLANGNKCSGGVTACCEKAQQIGLVNLNLGCTTIPINSLL